MAQGWTFRPSPLPDYLFFMAAWDPGVRLALWTSSHNACNGEPCNSESSRCIRDLASKGLAEMKAAECSIEGEKAVVGATILSEVGSLTHNPIVRALIDGAKSASAVTLYQDTSSQLLTGTNKSIAVEDEAITIGGIRIPKKAAPESWSRGPRSRRTGVGLERQAPHGAPEGIHDFLGAGFRLPGGEA